MINLYSDAHEYVTKHTSIHLLQCACLAGFCTLLWWWEEHTNIHIRVLGYTAPPKITHLVPSRFLCCHMGELLRPLGARPAPQPPSNRRSRRLHGQKNRQENTGRQEEMESEKHIRWALNIHHGNITKSLFFFFFLPVLRWIRENTNKVKCSCRATYHWS